MASASCFIFSLYLVACCLTIATSKAPSRKVLAKKLDSLENEFKVFKAESGGIENQILLQFAEREASIREDFAEKTAHVEKRLGYETQRVSEETNKRLTKLLAEQQEMKSKVQFLLDHFDQYVKILELDKVNVEKVNARGNSNCSDTSKCREEATGHGEDFVQTVQTSSLQSDVNESTSTSTSTATTASPSFTTDVTEDKSTSMSTSTASPSLSSTSSTTSLSTSTTTRISASRGPSEPRNRILMSRYFRESRTYFKQYHFDSGKTDTYPNLRGNTILAMTYDPTNRKIIYTRDSPSGIFASPLDENGVTSLLRKVGSEGLFVDEKRKLLFFTTFEPNNTISCITTSGKDYRIIASLYNRGFVSPRALTVDSDRETIYYNFRGRPQSMDFNGMNRVTYSVQKYGSYACGLDAFTNTLYYNDDKLIVKRDLTTGNTTILQELKEATRNIIWYDNTLYMSGWDHGGIYVIDLETNTMTKPVRGLTDYDHVIALLP